MTIPLDSKKPRPPYAVVGAGKLVATVWTTCERNSIQAYRFNTYNVDELTGTATQLFQPGDLPDLVRLCHALACTFVNDGCVTVDVRSRLSDLIDALDAASCADE